ncbi:hypothetical protein AMECASPLE_020721 [Ameca splendens]|uniref:Uncharacterized protein n=1 Tax=Ameca splendens TaxID=208324 RepID=A0ABV0ZZ34_9TELE
MRTLSTLLQASLDSPATAVLQSHLSPGSQPLSLADLTLPNSPCFCGFLHQIPKIKVYLNDSLFLRIFLHVGQVGHQHYDKKVLRT